MPILAFPQEKIITVTQIPTDSLSTGRTTARLGMGMGSALKITINEKRRMNTFKPEAQHHRNGQTTRNIKRKSETNRNPEVRNIASDIFCGLRKRLRRGLNHTSLWDNALKTLKKQNRAGQHNSKHRSTVRKTRKHHRTTANMTSINVPK